MLSPSLLHDPVHRDTLLGKVRRISRQYSGKSNTSVEACFRPATDLWLILRCIVDRLTMAYRSSPQPCSHRSQCFDFSSTLIKCYAGLCAKFFKNYGSRTKTSKWWLKKISANKCSNPQPVCAMEYRAGFNSQTKRNQYKSTCHCIDNSI